MWNRSFEGIERQSPSVRSSRAPLQRLFGTFPNGWPGLGLLLVRLCLGAALIHFRASGFLVLVVAIGTIALVAGLWTPVTGGLLAFEEALRALSLYSPPQDLTWIHAFLAVLSASVAMLGPGAWSLDARLFGRQRFDIDRARRRRSQSSPR